MPDGVYNFIIFFGFFLLITYAFFVSNTLLFLNISKKAILISQYLFRAQHFHSDMIDIFIAYRQYIFDDSIIIYNMLPFDYLDKTEKESYKTLSEDALIMKQIIQEFPENEEVEINLKKDYCLFKATDKFNSYEDCQEKIGTILKYDFSFIASNFIEELRINRYLIKYLLSTGTIRGNLNDYDENIWLKDETIPKVGENYTGENIFRLDLYNNETLHAHLDLIFVNIILPFIDIIRKIIIPHLTIEGKMIFLNITSVFYLVFIFLIFFVYLLVKIKIINNHIYKTKNLLTLIPIHILSTQNNIKELLDL